MRICCEWLADLVEVPPLPKLLEAIAQTGLDIDKVVDVALELADVRVAQIVDKRPLSAEQADSCVYHVSTGERQAQVVSKDTALAIGDKVPWAPVGSKLYEQSIASKRFAGVESEGMLCSKADLGLAHSAKGVWLLPPQTSLELPLTQAIGLQPMVEIALPAHRSDVLCYQGIGRELGAVLAKRIKSSKGRLVEKGQDISSLLRGVVEEQGLAKRFALRVVRSVNVRPSPAWLQERLERSGLRPVNNVVDVTNYVCLELGVPVHAYDLAAIAVEGGLPTLTVRKAKAGEQLTLLTGQKITLQEQDIVVADSQRPLVLAGVMGGMESQISPNTTQVVLEAGAFAPRSIRSSSQLHQVQTEASKRSERGIDPNQLQKALEKAAALLVDIGDGDACKGCLEIGQKNEPPLEMPLRLQRISQLLGQSFAAETIVGLLEPLEIRCVGRAEGALIFQVPSFRTDLTREVDLIEEVARRAGFEQFPATLPNRAGVYQEQTPVPQLVPVLRQLACAAGGKEHLGFGFGRSDDMESALGQGKKPVLLANPLGEELRALRTSLLPSMLRHAQQNSQRERDSIFLFEVGTIFSQHEQQSELPREHLAMAAIWTGLRNGGHVYERGALYDMTDVTGLLQLLAGHFPHVQLAWQAGEHPGWIPNTYAQITLGQEPIGQAGCLLPHVLNGLESKYPLWAMQIQLDGWRSMHRPLLRAASISPFPAMRRDVALVVGIAQPLQELTDFLKAHAGGALGAATIEEVRIFDIYTDRQLEANQQRSVAWKIIYRGEHQTLLEEQVQSNWEACLARLLQTFPVTLRR